MALCIRPCSGFVGASCPLTLEGTSPWRGRCPEPRKRTVPAPLRLCSCLPPAGGTLRLRQTTPPQLGPFPTTPLLRGSGADSPGLGRPATSSALLACLMGEPCQEPALIGLSDPWKPSQPACGFLGGPSPRSLQSISSATGEEAGMDLWMNLLTGSEPAGLPSCQLLPGKAWPSLPLPNPMQGQEGQAQHSADSDPCPG